MDTATKASDYNDLLKLGIDEVLSLARIGQRMQWVPVSERLPELGTMILILTVHETIEVSWLKKDNWWYFRNSCEPFSFATH